MGQTPALAAVAAQIAAQIEEWDNPAVERAIFGMSVPEHIAALVDAFCRRELGSGIAAPLFYRSSIGVVFGLELDDGRRLVLKGHQPDVPAGYLAAVVSITRRLAESGFPCPRPLAGPR